MTAAELFVQLVKRAVDVPFAVRPVAGRTSGHMNVLLAEPDVPYDGLFEVDDIDSDMPMCDVCLVAGANDVRNSAARHDAGSPIDRMPIIDADRARRRFAIRRSANPGLAGIETELSLRDHTFVLFGGAKAVIDSAVNALREGTSIH